VDRKKLRLLNIVKFSFGKQSEHFKIFNDYILAYDMYTPGYGFSIPEYWELDKKIRAVLMSVYKLDGIFLFNISGVDIVRSMKGFSSFDEADGNNLITEWELSIILSEPDYKFKTIFHNGITEFKITPKGLKIKWN
jgi:hypothetical protein